MAVKIFSDTGCRAVPKPLDFVTARLFTQTRVMTTECRRACQRFTKATVSGSVKAASPAAVSSSIANL